MSHPSSSPRALRTAAFLPAVLGALLLFAASGLVAEEIQAVLVGPRKLYPGSEGSATLYTFSGSGSAPRAVPYEVRLVPEGGGAGRLLASGVTSAEGWAAIPITLPATEQSGAFLVLARVDGMSEDLATPLDVEETRLLLIETDKPVYRPGQRIQGRVLLLNNALRPLPGRVEVEMLDGRGLKVGRQVLEADEFGVAAFDLALADELNSGEWKIQAWSGQVKAEAAVRVEQYVLPRFRLEVELDRGWFVPGERISGTIRGSYFFGKPVEGQVTVSGQRLLQGTWDAYGQTAVPLAGGSARFEIEGPPPQAPGELTQFSLEVRVTDSAGHEETVRQVVRLVDSPVVVRLGLRSPSAKPGLPVEVAVETTDPDGRPLSRDVSLAVSANNDQGQTLQRQEQRLRTQGGRGTASFSVPSGIEYLLLEAEAEEGAHRSLARLYGKVAFSPTSSFLQVTRAGAGPVQVGQLLEFRLQGSSQGLTYYQVQSGGRTVQTGSVAGDVLRFPAAPSMAPEAKLLVYRVFSNNELGCDSQSFRVRPGQGAPLEVSFSAERVQPGEPVKVEIAAAVPSMVGLAIVDESVLALGERLDISRLHQALTERFGGPSEADLQNRFADRPHTLGARDLLSDLGYEVAVSRNPDFREAINVPVGFTFFAGSKIQRGGYSLPKLDVADGSGGSPRVRQFFPETWVWSPLLRTDTAGRASLSLTAPDSITNWKLRAVSTSPEGLGLAAGDLVVFQDFFVEPDLPAAVTRGEEITLPVTVFSYVDRPQRVSLSLEAGDGLEVLGQATAEVDVEANSVTAAHFPVRATSIGTFPLKITARGAIGADAVLRPVRVVPEGAPREEVQNASVAAGQRITLRGGFPSEAVPGSEKLVLTLSGSKVAQSISGLADLVGMPYGCGEQNMLFTSVDLEVLRYLRARGEGTSELALETQEHLAKGYQQELTYQHPDGWFNAFVYPGQTGSLWLTAFCLTIFSQSRDLVTIDEKVLEDAARWMLSHQKEDGHWDPVGFVIHTELLGGVSGNYGLTGFVTTSLLDFGRAPGGALARARAYLEANLERAGSDHSLAVGAYALARMKSPRAAEAASLLLSRAGSDGSLRPVWNDVPVETASYALLALAESGQLAQLQGPASWLADQKNSRGGFGNTQDTVMAMRALMRDALANREGTDLTVRVERGGEVVAVMPVNAANFDVSQSLSLVPGEEVTVSAEGRGPATVQVARLFHQLPASLRSQGGLELEVRLDRTRAAVGSTLPAEAVLRYRGERQETGMVVAEIGVPTGLRPDQASLDALIGQDGVRRVDVRGRKVEFYLDKLTAGQTVRLGFNLVAALEARAAAAPSRAYDYYDASISAVDGGRPVWIGPEGEEAPFLRGDSNSDGRVEIADGIRTLDYLFLGYGPVHCLDAFDANDDGEVELTDAIVVLFYLFAGGVAPARPFPEAGLDPTPDSLTCSFGS